MVRAELETEQNCNILTPTLMAVSVVFLSRSPGLFNRRPRGPALCWMMAFFTASYHQLVSKTTGGPESPFSLVWLSLPHLVSNSISSLTVWPPVLTALYNSSTSTQSPTQSLEWHVSSSSGNNCHAVQRSHSSGASVYECTIGILPCPISSAKSAHVISFDYWPLECVNSFRHIILEWHVWPGRRSKYNNTTLVSESYRLGNTRGTTIPVWLPKKQLL